MAVSMIGAKSSRKNIIKIATWPVQRKPATEEMRPRYEPDTFFAKSMFLSEKFRICEIFWALSPNSENHFGYSKPQKEAVLVGAFNKIKTKTQMIK
uniref:Uncharacterized protein n=1 Tax=Romanomermis culicivorax TaxID=13658 RepID=A0A915L0M2_ROMCU